MHESFIENYKIYISFFVCIMYFHGVTAICANINNIKQKIFSFFLPSFLRQEYEYVRTENRVKY